ncbi:GNAT family N-acetyltransferase [Thalassotalea sp. PLHSN55]|uniref:GNAT family N-acetyltransferase n=1 Tax=Thalassotalea sp. PLHSN55 TaxID=3435888 RepID=UPI003F83B6F5
MYIKNNYIIYKSKNYVDVHRVKQLLSASYWAADRSFADIKLSIEHSECFSLYEGDLQIGFARVVTDYSTFAYLADVIIDHQYRSKGLGKWLVDIVVNDSRWRKKFLVLATDDAHQLYEKHGFKQSAKLMGVG